MKEERQLYKLPYYLFTTYQTIISLLAQKLSRETKTSNRIATARTIKKSAELVSNINFQLSIKITEVYCKWRRQHKKLNILNAQHPTPHQPPREDKNDLKNDIYNFDIMWKKKDEAMNCQVTYLQLSTQS